MTKFNFAPGDLIEWRYWATDRLVRPNEELYSSIENEWVPIGSNLVHMCVRCENRHFTWLNEKGAFNANYLDDRALGSRSEQPRVIPRKARS